MSKNFSIVIFIFSLLLVTMPSYTEKDIPSNKEEARCKFLEATKKLNQLGGIASFDSPSKQSPFPHSDIRSLSAEQVNRILKEVITDLKIAIKLDPELNEAYYFLGMAYVRMQDQDNAIKAFEKTIDVEPHREISYIILCNLLWDEKRYEEALEVSSRFLHVFPKKKAAGLSLIGTTYYKKADFDKAIKVGNEIIGLDDKNIEGHLLLGSSYYSLGDKEASESEFKKILEINPQMEIEIKNLKERLNQQRTR